MKKIISLTLILLVVLSSLVVFPASAVKILQSGDWQYINLSDGSVKLWRYTGSNHNNIVIPNKIEGKKVTRISAVSAGAVSIKIGRYVEKVDRTGFSGSQKLEKVTVDSKNKFFASENGLLLNKAKTKLVAYPGGMKNTSLSLPDSVKYIGREAFEYNNYLEKAVFPKSVKQIGEYAFAGARKLNTVKIPKTVSRICMRAFDDCKYLHKLTFKNNEKLIIEHNAFDGCINLNEINLPLFDAEKSGGNWFSGCNLKTLTIRVGVKAIPESCFVGADINTISFPESVKKIGKHAFFGVDEMKSVTIPETVTNIGKQSFGYTLTDDPDSDGIYKTIKIKGFVIKGKKNSAAEKYAKKNGLKFKAIK